MVPIRVNRNVFIYNITVIHQLQPQAGYGDKCSAKVSEGILRESMGHEESRVLTTL